MWDDDSCLDSTEIQQSRRPSFLFHPSCLSTKTTSFTSALSGDDSGYSSHSGSDSCFPSSEKPLFDKARPARSTCPIHNGEGGLPDIVYNAKGLPQWGLESREFVRSRTDTPSKSPLTCGRQTDILGDSDDDYEMETCSHDFGQYRRFISDRDATLKGRRYTQEERIQLSEDETAYLSRMLEIYRQQKKAGGEGEHELSIVGQNGILPPIANKSGCSPVFKSHSNKAAPAARNRSGAIRNSRITKPGFQNERVHEITCRLARFRFNGPGKSQTPAAEAPSSSPRAHNSAFAKRSVSSCNSPPRAKPSGRPYSSVASTRLRYGETAYQYHLRRWLADRYVPDPDAYEQDPHDPDKFLNVPRPVLNPSRIKSDSYKGAAWGIAEKAKQDAFQIRGLVLPDRWRADRSGPTEPKRPILTGRPDNKDRASEDTLMRDSTPIRGMLIDRLEDKWASGTTEEDMMSLDLNICRGRTPLLIPHEPLRKRNVFKEDVKHKLNWDDSIFQQNLPRINDFPVLEPTAHVTVVLEDSEPLDSGSLSPTGELPLPIVPTNDIKKKPIEIPWGGSVLIDLTLDDD